MQRTEKGINAFRNPLPLKICFRVTRFCNARCGFCLAPPDGGIHPQVTQLKQYVDWLLERGVRIIHFCGGEPTIHHDLPQLIEYVCAKGGKSKLTTNGIQVSDKLIATLYASHTEVKVSLHGPPEFHDAIVGRAAFDKTTDTVRRLLASGVHTYLQTTIVHDHLEIIEWIIDFSVKNKIKRVSFLPFIPRGSGYENSSTYELLYHERSGCRALIKQLRKKFNSILDIRLLDFNVDSVPVVEPDGRIVMESSTEAKDVFLYQIPIANNITISNPRASQQ